MVQVHKKYSALQLYKLIVTLGLSRLYRIVTNELFFSQEDARNQYIELVDSLLGKTFIQNLFDTIASCMFCIVQFSVFNNTYLKLIDGFETD